MIKKMQRIDFFKKISFTFLQNALSNSFFEKLFCQIFISTKAQKIRYLIIPILLYKNDFKKRYNEKSVINKTCCKFLQRQEKNLKFYYDKVKQQKESKFQFL